MYFRDYDIVFKSSEIEFAGLFNYSSSVLVNLGVSKEIQFQRTEQLQPKIESDSLFINLQNSVTVDVVGSFTTDIYNVISTQEYVIVDVEESVDNLNILISEPLYPTLNVGYIGNNINSSDALSIPISTEITNKLFDLVDVSPALNVNRYIDSSISSSSVLNIPILTESDASKGIQSRQHLLVNLDVSRFDVLREIRFRQYFRDYDIVFKSSEIEFAGLFNYSSSAATSLGTLREIQSQRTEQLQPKIESDSPFINLQNSVTVDVVGSFTTDVSNAISTQEYVIVGVEESVDNLNILISESLYPTFNAEYIDNSISISNALSIPISTEITNKLFDLVNIGPTLNVGRLIDSDISSSDALSIPISTEITNKLFGLSESLYPTLNVSRLVDGDISSSDALSIPISTEITNKLFGLVDVDPFISGLLVENTVFGEASVIVGVDSFILDLDIFAQESLPLSVTDVSNIYKYYITILKYLNDLENWVAVNIYRKSNVDVWEQKVAKTKQTDGSWM